MFSHDLIILSHPYLMPFRLASTTSCPPSFHQTWELLVERWSEIERPRQKNLPGCLLAVHIEKSTFSKSKKDEAVELAVPSPTDAHKIYLCYICFLKKWTLDVFQKVRMHLEYVWKIKQYFNIIICTNITQKLNGSFVCGYLCCFSVIFFLSCVFLF